MQQQPETQELRHSWAGRPDEGGEDEIDLVELMYRLLEKWKIIVLACILGALIAGVYTICFVTPMYTATSKLYVVNAKDSAINLSDLQVGNYLASDYTEVFSNWHVHEMVNGWGLTIPIRSFPTWFQSPTRRIRAFCMSRYNPATRRRPRIWRIPMRRLPVNLSR